jgi:hypothetical protein
MSASSPDSPVSFGDNPKTSFTAYCLFLHNFASFLTSSAKREGIDLRASSKLSAVACKVFFADSMYSLWALTALAISSSLANQTFAFFFATDTVEEPSLVPW